MKKKVKRKKDKKQEKERGKINLMVFLVVLLLIEGYFIIAYYSNYDVLDEAFGIRVANYLKKTENCKTKACFDSALEKCEKASYVSDSQNMWKYTILKEKAKMCVVDVKLLQVKRGVLDSQRLEGKEMQCEIPLGSVYAPESDLSRCKGELKEEIQEIVIERMHSYIIENIGKVTQKFEVV